MVLLGVNEPKGARLLFSRGENVDHHMGNLLKEIVGKLGGRGGGAPNSAQGMVAEAGQLEKALERAQKEI